MESHVEFPVEDDDDEEDLPESVDAMLSRWWRSLSPNERTQISLDHEIDGKLNPRSRVWCLSR